MAKRKLRSIVIDGARYLYRLNHRYDRAPTGGFTTHYTFVAYLADHERTRLEVHFDTWESAIAGGPLHTGAQLDLVSPASPTINLNRPGDAAALIRRALTAGWSPSTQDTPFTIADGLPLLAPAPARDESSSKSDGPT